MVAARGPFLGDWWDVLPARLSSLGLEPDCSREARCGEPWEREEAEGLLKRLELLSSVFMGTSTGDEACRSVMLPTRGLDFGVDHRRESELDSEESGPLARAPPLGSSWRLRAERSSCLLYTSDAADD